MKRMRHGILPKPPLRANGLLTCITFLIGSRNRPCRWFPGVMAYMSSTSAVTSISMPVAALQYLAQRRFDEEVKRAIILQLDRILFAHKAFYTS